MLPLLKNPRELYIDCYMLFNLPPATIPLVGRNSDHPTRTPPLD